MQKKPFFARFLETESAAELPVNTEAKAGATAKHPSDKDESLTMKYPSDGDDSYEIF
jgi:hypothetical protein